MTSSVNVSIILDEIVNALRASGMKTFGVEGRSGFSFCPCHKDTETKSLGIGIGDRNKDHEKKIVLCCYAGCTYQEIHAWLTARGVNFPKKESQPSSDNTVWKELEVAAYGLFRFPWDAAKADPVMEKLHVYRRKNGEAYAFKMRFTPKTFKRFSFQGSKIRANWAGVEMDPYNWDKGVSSRIGRASYRHPGR